MNMSPIGQHRLLNVQQAAAYTGLSPHTVYAMVSQRRIPYVKKGPLIWPMNSSWRIYVK